MKCFPAHILLRSALALIALNACASQRGEWPSLARVPGVAASCEGGVPTETSAAPCAAAPVSPAPSVPPAPQSAAIDIGSLESRFAEARAAWTAQRSVTETAVKAAANAARGDSAWAAAELQLSRLERRAAEFGTIADALGIDSPAKDGARVAALRSAVQTASDTHISTFARLRGALTHE